MDTIRSWLVCLIPRCVCSWLFNNVTLGVWAPHIFGRILGSDAKRVK